MATKKCPECGCDMELVYTDPKTFTKEYREIMKSINEIAKKALCDNCSEKAKKIKQEQAEKDYILQKATYSNIPEFFWEWDREKGNLKLMNWVWKNRDKSLFISDSYGTNKTRVVCAVGYKMVPYLTIKYFRTTDLINRLSSMYSNDVSSAERYKKHLSNIDLLILDDFGKERMTDRGGECLYSIIDNRYISDKNMWITSNFTGTDLVEKIGEDRGHAILRRLKEMCLDWSAEN